MLPFREIVDPELVLFAEADGQVVGWFPGLPNLNEAFPREWAALPVELPAGLVGAQTAGKCLAIKSVLVLPEYWDTGVAVMLFDEMAKRALRQGLHLVRHVADLGR